LGFSEAKQHVLRDFLFCVQNESIPALRQYFPDFVRNGGSLSPDDYRLFPITATALGCLTTSSDCLTDGMLELQARYEQRIPGEWGDYTERGWREVGVIGFNVLPGIVLDIVAIEKTTRPPDWADPKLEGLAWEQILIRAVVDFAQVCKAKQIRLQPGQQCPPSTEIRADPARLAAFQAAAKRRHDDNARASGFDHDEALHRFVFDL
jgi:hypothetical protein